MDEDEAGGLSPEEALRQLDWLRAQLAAFDDVAGGALRGMRTGTGAWRRLQGERREAHEAASILDWLRPIIERAQRKERLRLLGEEDEDEE